MIKKTVSTSKNNNENGARKAILEDLFYDFHTSRRQVYLMNLIRGIFFGVGSVLGGTIVIAIVLWILNLLVDVPGGFGQFIQFVVNTVQQSPKK
ncbi:MAG: hypothetical protein EOT05_03835 [Candidatus Microsaccharimonas sossegonensis]|uniref:Uncharacterized protein n=1 Tax=Candidatus Microsaccharimonas sossegonensis TaxID=2506948 RepID=A0A4Q0AJJ5_9BACT|nr:MAG: hypothetical protein EOT05_03835 [Candidatus Microsaccharimonas sossegonensis]